MHGLRSRAGTVALTACAFALLSVPVIALGKGPPEGKGGGPEPTQAVVPPQANVPEPPPGQLNRPAPPGQLNRPAPPGQLNRPAAPKQVQAPKPAPAGQAKPKPSAGPKPAPPGHVKRQATAPAPGNGRGPDASGPAPGGPNPKPPAHARARGHVKYGPSPKPAGGSADPASPQGEPAQSGSADEPSRSPSPEEPDPIGGIELPSADEPGGEEAADADAAAAVVGDTVELPEDASPETLPFTGLQLGLIALAGLAVMAGGLALRRTVDR